MTHTSGVQSSLPCRHSEEHDQGQIVFSLDAPTTHIPAASPDSSDRQTRTRIRTQWTARLATPADAELLQIPCGTVVLHILRTITDANSNVIKTTTRPSALGYAPSFITATRSLRACDPTPSSLPCRASSEDRRKLGLDSAATTAHQRPATLSPVKRPLPAHCSAESACTESRRPLRGRDGARARRACGLAAGPGGPRRPPRQRRRATGIGQTPWGSAPDPGPHSEISRNRARQRGWTASGW